MDETDFKKFLNDFLDLGDILVQYGHLTERESKKTHNIYCPFHENTNTPHARLNLGEKGVSHIYCFLESKRYFVTDVLQLNGVSLASLIPQYSSVYKQYLNDKILLDQNDVSEKYSLSHHAAKRAKLIADMYGSLAKSKRVVSLKLDYIQDLITFQSVGTALDQEIFQIVSNIKAL